MELVYMYDSKSYAVRLKGSSPLSGIKLKSSLRCDTASFKQGIITFRIIAFKVTTDEFKEMNLNENLLRC